MNTFFRAVLGSQQNSEEGALISHINPAPIKAQPPHY